MTDADPQRFCAADLYDVHAASLRVCALQFRSFGQRGSFWGRAETLRTFEDHTPVLNAVSQPGAGRVLVVDAGGSLRVGVMGDRLAAIAQQNGWAGVVIHGAIRDSRGINALDIGVKAMGTTARRGWAPTQGTLGETLTLGEVSITPAEWVYCDEDAVMVSDRFLDPVGIAPQGLE
ncbi:ribonuclease E activity regulator RraA [Pararhodobacter zhoushanensis]|uniref:4-hydroxy-4-methyl-2-oxoglutarate aldolase n=1 Tax=Pararhodobacter zhoushanensis TaxID=2479545 RepID=A0ABT3GU37_9RHOB|nr:ribonuclease E activity regulator RraA [Pararhodobacter zhoushanensis]MCW1931048.1 ribonuclease E activity regulator RraA [Pararhodobacter zhoushanensis]